LIKLLIFGLGCQSMFALGALPEFAYRDVILKVVQADGKPVPGASVYGFCHELNLVWRPDRDHELEGRNNLLWDKSYLGKTDLNGSIKATVPPGKWGFFAAGQAAGDRGRIVAVWTDFRERSAGEVIPLTPTVTKHWVLRSADAASLEPKRIFLVPEDFPIWIPASLARPKEPLQIEMTAGQVRMWAVGDATADHPGFALGWGTLNDEIADGGILAAGKAAVLECKGGKGQASLSWFRWQNVGLEGSVSLCDDAKVLLAPGMFTLSYRRPVAAGLSGNFVGQCYNLREGQPILLNMETPIESGLDQARSKPNRNGNYKIIGQLYLADGNGHVLSDLFDASNNPVYLDATVILNQQRFPAHPDAHEAQAPGTDDEDEPMLGNARKMKFMAEVGAISSGDDAVWDFTAPPGVLPQSRLTKSALVTVGSATFRMDVPPVLRPQAQNILAQAEMLAAVMQQVSDRHRKVTPTVITIDAQKIGAVSAHNGSHSTLPSGLLFDDLPIVNHTFVHELGHNFDFRHGGLQETVVEESRCGGGEQISAQPSKWMFMDRMNGIVREETPYKYPNVGLYLYCYSQGGLNFLHFMSVNEYAVINKLSKQGYAKDEVTTALLGLALGRDMTRICSSYGLGITPERVADATRAARDLCHAP